MTHGLLTNRKFQIRCAAAAAVVALVLLLVSAFAGGGRSVRLSAATQAKAHVSHTRMTLIDAAAREFGTPASLLLALSYDQTRWERTGAAPSVDGGYGLMDLTAKTYPSLDGRGDPAHPAPRDVTQVRTHYTLDEAARLLKVTPGTLKTDERQNVRGAAALLASYARSLNGGTLPTSLSGWYGAVAEYSGDTSLQAAESFADGVFATLRNGASLITQDDQAMDLAAQPSAHTDHAVLSKLALKPAAALAPSATAVDCPSTVTCTFTPAAYQEDTPGDPTDYGNYATAGRPSSMTTPAGQPASMKIRYIVIHDTEGSYAGTIATFQNPASYVSAHYVIKSSNGAITEMVRPQNVSWGAGNWYVNMHAINIELEGFAAQGRTWYTSAMYNSATKLVKYLAGKYGIPVNRAHIIGHEDVPGPTDALTKAQHWDPGPFFDWTRFMALLDGVSEATERARGGSITRGTHQVVTIDPTFSSNTQAVTDCSGGTCTTLPSQPTDFVYIRTGPKSTYPLIGDPIVHPTSAGTTQDSDWTDKATAGEKFVFAGQSGSWTAIWFRGIKGWFYNSPTSPRARFTSGTVIAPKAGVATIPVYGAAYPEASVYPSQIPVEQFGPLKYTIPAGQAYTMVGSVPTDYYYSPTIDSSLPDDHTVVIGGTLYYQIGFNHRRFFVNSGDVVVKTLP
jgi:N-acetyl-anhydromuramyl-L-alanine amidase AmpD